MTITTQFYDNFWKDVGLKRVDFSSDVLKAVLVNGYTYDETHSSYSQITGEPSTANGYTVGGAALANPNWDWSSGSEFTRFDADDVPWAASGGSIGPVTGAVIYNSSTASPNTNRLVCYVDFGGAVTINDSSQFKLTFHTDGVFSVTQDS